MLTSFIDSFFASYVTSFIAGLIVALIFSLILYFVTGLVAGPIADLTFNTFASHIIFVIINLNTFFYYEKKVIVKDFTNLKLNKKK